MKLDQFLLQLFTWRIIWLLLLRLTLPHNTTTRLIAAGTIELFSRNSVGRGKAKRMIMNGLEIYERISIFSTGCHVCSSTEISTCTSKHFYQFV